MSRTIQYTVRFEPASDAFEGVGEDDITAAVSKGLSGGCSARGCYFEYTAPLTDESPFPFVCLLVDGVSSGASVSQEGDSVTDAVLTGVESVVSASLDSWEVVDV